jgi:hypothetical protein
MSVVTIQIPTDQIAALRESLANRRLELERQSPRRDDGGMNGTPERSSDLSELIEQMRPDRVRQRGAMCEVKGPRAVLWRAAYDVLCAAAERFAEDCGEYWRGDIDPAHVRAEAIGLVSRLDVLIELEDRAPAPR